MKHRYELWDTASSNLVGSYPTRKAALAVVRNAVREHGPGVFDTIALGGEDDRGNVVPIAQGRALVELAANRGPKRSGGKLTWIRKTRMARRLGLR